jgi:hypothetical protein
VKINRSQLIKGLPLDFEGELQSIVPFDGTRLLLVTLEYGGVDVLVPLSREAIASVLTEKGIVSSNPGEVIPVKHPKKSGAESRKGPKVGSTKTTNGIQKRLARYDFITPRLKGKRRVTCPETGRKGFPIWERI